MTIHRFTKKEKIGQEEADQLVKSLCGERVSLSWRGYGSAIYLELGSLRPYMPSLKYPGRLEILEGQITIMIQWSWRIEDDNSIIVGSWSDDKDIDTAPALLKNLFIKELGFLGVQKEIQIFFQEGMYFTSFSTVESDPQWAIMNRINNTTLSFEDGSFQLERESLD